MTQGERRRNAWSWVPTLYFAEGIPYVVVMTVAVVLYKRMGISNSDIALYTSWLYLPWVIKPLWSPFVDLLRTRRFWILTTQLLLGAGLAGVALTIPTSDAFRYSLAIFWLLAFSSATHDIAADGFYMLGLDENKQAYFVGIRSTFYRFAMIAGQGLLIMLAGWLEDATGLEPVRIEVKASVPAQVEPLDLSELLHELQMKGPGLAPDPGPEGELHLVPARTTLELDIGTHDAAVFEKVREDVAYQNRNHGHDFEPGDKEGEGASPSEPTWWQRNVSVPLGNTLRDWFGEEVAPPDKVAGSFGIVGVRLSQPPEPGKEVVVHLGHSSGDKSISLIEGSRLRFTSENWAHSGIVLFELDHRLRADTSAVFEGRAGNVPVAWSITFIVLAGLFLVLFLWHRFALPRPASDVPGRKGEGAGFLREFQQTFALFFRRKGIWMIMAFLLLYRFGEAQLVKLAAPFLLDPSEVGGLGLTTGQVGFVYGTVGVAFLTLGGIAGGIVASRHGLRRWLLWMVAAINLPNAVYVYLSFTQPDSLAIVNLCVAIEQFGYGFGFTAYMLYMIYVSRGAHKTAHYAICTGFMALGMMLPGMFSGWLQEAVGYRSFFVWVMIATIPAFVIAALVKVDPTFGKSRQA